MTCSTLNCQTSSSCFSETKLTVVLHSSVTFCVYKGNPTIFSKNFYHSLKWLSGSLPVIQIIHWSSPGPPALNPAPFWGKGSPAGSTTERSLMFCFSFTFLHQEFRAASKDTKSRRVSQEEGKVPGKILPNQIHQ